MFTSTFLSWRRELFAEQVVQAVYTFEVDGEQDVALAYFLNRSIEDTTIYYTFRLPNTQNAPHKIIDIYLFLESADLTEILNEPSASGRISALNGFVSAELEKGYIGVFPVDTQVNAFQSYAVRLNVQYWETDEDIST